MALTLTLTLTLPLGYHTIIYPDHGMGECRGDHGIGHGMAHGMVHGVVHGMVHGMVTFSALRVCMNRDL